jgi:hypothetical protein
MIQIADIKLPALEFLQNYEQDPTLLENISKQDLLAVIVYILSKDKNLRTNYEVRMLMKCTEHIRFFKE